MLLWFLVMTFMTNGALFAQVPTFSLSIHDDQFVPKELQVPAGQKIELIVRNERTVTAEFESMELRREKIVPTGQQVSVFVGPLRPGDYEFFDDFNPQNRGHLIAR
jgi:hypothetical protein